jgi:hypothetical protein
MPEGLDNLEVSVDSIIARAHQHAAGARKGGTGNAKNRAESISSPPITPLGAPGVADQQAAPGGRGWPTPPVDRGYSGGE